MSTQLVKIFGQLTDSNGNNLSLVPFGTSVEFTRTSGSSSPGGWIGSAPVGVTDGHFEVFTSYNMPSTEEVNFRVLNGKQEVQAGTVTFDTYEANIALTEDAYDDLFLTEVTGYTTIKGKVTLGEELIKATPLPTQDVIIEVYKKGFRTTELIGTTALDIHGNYVLKVSNNHLYTQTGTCGNEVPNDLIVTLKTETLDTEEQIVLANATELTGSKCGLVADFHISEENSFVYFLTEMDYMRNRLQDVNVMDEEDIKNIIIEGESAELITLSAATGTEVSQWQALVKAARVADELGVSVEEIYPMLRKSCHDIYEVTALTDSEIDDCISAAGDNHIITPLESLEALHAALTDKRVVFSGQGLTGNDETLLAVLTAIMSSETDALTFLKLSTIAAASEEADLWDSVNTALGSTKKTRLQKALQLLAVTGMQKEMTIAVLDTLGSSKVSSLTQETEANWETRIIQVNALHDKLCIPKIITDNYTEETEAIEFYAAFIYDALSDIFATTVLTQKLDTDSAFAAKVDELENVKTFLAANPELDLRVDNLWDIADDGYDGLVREALLPLQNISRLAGSQPAAVIAMIKNDIRSSRDIVAMSEDDFVALFEEDFKGGAAQAGVTYTRAIHASRMNIEAKIAMSTGNYISDMFPMLSEDEETSLMAAPAATPDLKTLFGSMDLCSCSECTSMYSPGAYFTDILNFMKKKLGTNPSLAFRELNRRRPDLAGIDISCKNANTPLPYIDLVNELLEKTILTYKASSLTLTTAIPDSFQTSGTAKELEAYPEHTYKEDNVYKEYKDYKLVYTNVLRAAEYPNNLPFDLPLEETRTYMKHLGANRYDLMYQFRNGDYAGTTQETNALAEWLGLSAKEAEIISTPYASNKNVSKYFGLEGNATWYNVLTEGENGEGLGTLLHRSRISYKEMLQMLTCDYLSPVITVSESNGSGGYVTKQTRAFTVESTDPLAPDTCDLTKLHIHFHKEDEDQNPYNSTVLTDERKFLFDKWHRFLRLKRATGWSFYQLDIVLKSLDITGIRTEVLSVVNYHDVDEAIFRNVVKVHQLASSLAIAPEKLCTMWSIMDNTRYINFDSDTQNGAPSVYDNLFRNKAVLNPANENFEETGTISGTYPEQVPNILAAFGIEEEDWNKLQVYWQVGIAPLTLEGLSRVYGSTLLLKALKITADDLIQLTGIMDVDLLTGTATQRFDELLNLLSVHARLQKLAFNKEEVAYIVTGEDVEGAFLENEDIQHFFETLRTKLQNVQADPIPLNTPEDEMAGAIEAAEELKAARRLNLIEDYFSSGFGIGYEITHTLLDSMLSITTNTSTLKSLASALQNEEFIFEDNSIEPSNGVTEFDYSELYLAYRKLSQVSLIISRMKLSRDTFFAISGAAFDLQIDIIDSILSNSLITNDLKLQQFIALNDWIMIRDRYAAKDADFGQLLFHAAIDSVGDDWKTAVIKITKWIAEDLDDVLDILDIDFSSNDNRNSLLLHQITEVFKLSKSLGMRPEKVHDLLAPDISMDDSKDVRMAAKAHYTDDAWAKIAKPLQDILRERQRQSMVSYIIGTPNVLKTKKVNAPPTDINSSVYNENELFEFLLIDVEMKPCMKTSRIKQGISSAQLFMDRIVLALENVDGIFGNLITITNEKLAQWESWRKWYRVWEANRKIFLYPENWIEPELRDDKTPFFKELETQLLQDEVKESTAKDAYLAYLERVDEVARLEPVASFREKDNGVDILHVFARTYSEPHRYFYRKLQHSEWTPWQKMNVDIKSDHIAPLVWNNRLMIFWLSFKTKKPSNPATPVAGTWVNTVTGQNASAAILKDTENDRNSIVEVTLNWSEYKDGKWLSTQFGRDTMTIDVSKIRLGAATKSSYQAPAATLKDFSKQFCDDGNVKLDELFKNRLRLYINTASYTPEKELIFNVQMAHGLNEVSLGLHSFAWRDSSAEPRVVRETDYGCTIVAPKGTRFHKTKMVQYGGEKLNMTSTYGYGLGYYLYDKDYLLAEAKILARQNSDIVLNSTPNGTFKVTARANAFGATAIFPERNPIEDNFFFEDNLNTFYVQKETGTFATQQAVYNGIMKENNVSLGLIQTYTPEKSIGLAVKPQLSLGPVFSGVTTTGEKYRFHTFYHAQISRFIRELYRNGVPGLLKLSNQMVGDGIQFQPAYQPNLAKVHASFPSGEVQFDFDQAYSIYNWEIFFHAPMMIAQRLSANQQFEEARKWYHYIFDPTSTKDISGALSTAKKRFWKFYPFYNEAQQPAQTLTQLLQAIHLGQQQALKQVEKWENNPFKPHVIARMRILAYMKNVLMKYLDNLFAWADQLYSRDTIESINEATQLYILAAELLGKRPEEVPARATTGSKTFTQLDGSLDALSNAVVQIESYFAPNSGPLPSSGSKDHGNVDAQMFYFCLPKNDKLLKYWDTVADRLFKIRNCMNIDGVTRQLPLYEPPIDPALLVRAAAAGISVGTLLDSISGTNQSPYRFNYMLQKANEFTNDVKGLGNSLLSAIEKKDAEQLALIRSGQEMQLLDKVRIVKEIQITEAEANLEAVRRTKENAQMRQLYYGSRVFMNGGETQHLSSLQTGMILQGIQGGLSTAAGVFAMIPQFHAQVIAAVGASYGGQQIASALNAASSAIGIAATINNARGSMALTRAGYERRMDDWKFQASSATKEMEQLDQQILAAEIRVDMAQRELVNHDQQIENAAETDAYMRSKFSNTELYSWMIGQIQATYFQSYLLAYDLAKKAEACFDLELPGFQKPALGFIGFAYWDSLRKGLLSGEKLQFDLRKMESAYMDANQRELELTKNISLVVTDPKALLDLRQNGICDIFVPEELYDLDYPGHYLRRIKSVSISIPCIAGPYTTVAATLTLKESKMRKNSSVPGTAESEAIVAQPGIATSAAQNDSGVFELNFRDERYLPFENRGAISKWELRLADDDQLRQFDFETISDVILHVKYTARDGGALLRDARKENLNTIIESTVHTDPGFDTLLLPRYISMKHDFSTQWHASFQNLSGYMIYSMFLTPDMFPEFTKGKTITIKKMDVHVKPKVSLAGTDIAYHVFGESEPVASATVDNLIIPREIEVPPAGIGHTITLVKTNTSGALPLQESNLEDVFLVMYYELS